MWRELQQEKYTPRNSVVKTNRDSEQWYGVTMRNSRLCKTREKQSVIVSLLPFYVDQPYVVQFS